MQNHDAAMGAYHRFINRPMHQNHLESTELLVYTNQGVRLRCISLGFLVIQRVILFMLSVGTNFQIFCSSTMRPWEHIWVLSSVLGSVDYREVDSPGNWHIISPRKGHFPADQLLQSFLSQGQSQGMCPLTALKNFCSSTLQVTLSQVPTWLWWWLSKIRTLLH